MLCHARHKQEGMIHYGSNCCSSTSRVEPLPIWLTSLVGLLCTVLPPSACLPLRLHSISITIRLHSSSRPTTLPITMPAMAA